MIKYKTLIMLLCFWLLTEYQVYIYINSSLLAILHFQMYLIFKYLFSIFYFWRNFFNKEIKFENIYRNISRVCWTFSLTAAEEKQVSVKIFKFLLKKLLTLLHGPHAKGM